MIIPKAKKQQNGLYAITLRVNGQTVTVKGVSEHDAVRQARIVKANLLNGEQLVLEGNLREAVQRYIDKYSPVLSPSTVRGYNIVLRNRFADYMDTPVKRIDFQRMVNDELKVVSEKTVRNGFGLVSAALKDAGMNVKVKLPAAPVKEIPFLQPDEIKPFCEAVKGKPYEVPALLELQGLRNSEVNALTEDHVDLKRKTITVKGSLVLGDNGLVRREANKTKSSTRTIPILIPQLVDALKRDGLSYTHDRDTLREDIRRACEAAGITVVSNHGLRHSFSSLCFYLNVPPMLVAEWGGWVNTGTIVKHYARLAHHTRQAETERFRAFFSEKCD